MTQSGDNNSTQYPHKDFENYVPRIAYTLGTVQPVRSTYIAHDPFFFMDIDEETLEAELLAEIEHEFSSFDHYESDEDEYSHLLDMLESFDENSAYVQGKSLPFSDLGSLEKILEKSRYGASLLEFATVNHIQFIAAGYVYGVEYNREENAILYQPVLNQMDLMKGVICALRQAWQNYQGALLQPVALYPDHAIFINRAHKADLTISLLRTAWELHLAYSPELWDNLEQSGLRDLTHTFGREAALDFRSLNNGRAAFAAFETWFLSDRSRASDTNLIQKMLSEYVGHHFDDEDMSQLVMIDLIKALGESPYGKNYLAQHIPNLLSDPIFTEVRDRSSANFLWFIKFEKTFSQVERELQKSNMSASATFSSQDDGYLSENFHLEGDHSDDKAFTEKGILISFPGQYKQSEIQKVVRHHGGTVIPFDITVRPFNGNFLK